MKMSIQWWLYVGGHFKVAASMLPLLSLHSYPHPILPSPQLIAPFLHTGATSPNPP